MQFRVVDCRPDNADLEQIVAAGTPEEAAFLALGERLLRGDNSSRRLALRAKVYWTAMGAPTMVRLYQAITADSA